MFTALIASFAVRLSATFLVALCLMLVLAKPMIGWLQKTQIGQVIRKEGPESHYNKKGTPTMGGLLMIIAISVSSLCFGDLSNELLWLALATLWLFGLIGFWDDYKKLILKHSKGLSARYKYFWQSIFALVLGIFLYHYFTFSAQAIWVFIPFSHGICLSLWSGLFLFLAYFTLVGGSNAVNLTDGLDGLAIISIILVAVGLGLIALVEAQIFPLAHVPVSSGVKEIAILAAAIFGAGLGFLWFNSFPALVFMGDVGSLALGALLGFMALALGMELVLGIMGAIFVLETLSVILQVGSFRLRNKKRIFKMAPIHHHFELSGWPEPRVVMRFSIMSVLFVLLGGISLLL